MDTINVIGNFQIERVPVSLDCVGYLFAEPFYVSGREYHPGTEITQTVIQEILQRSSGKRPISIRKYPQFQKNPHITEVRNIVSRVSEKIAELSKAVDIRTMDLSMLSALIRNIIERLVTDKKVDPYLINSRVMDVVDKTIMRIRTESKMNIPALISLMQSEDHIIHSVECMVYAINIAFDSGLDSSTVGQIATAALLHDVGVTLFSSDKSHLGARERMLFQAHTIMGMNLLSQNQTDITTTSLIAGTHHEYHGDDTYGVATNFASFVNDSIPIPKIISTANLIVGAADKLSTHNGNEGTNGIGGKILQIAVMGQCGELTRDMVRSIVRSFFKSHKTLFVENEAFEIPEKSYVCNTMSPGKYIFYVSRVDKKRPYNVAGRLYKINNDGSSSYDSLDKELSFENDLLPFLK